jgi:Fur family transcriptional regulator, ferric uptake regulator
MTITEQLDTIERTLTAKGSKLTTQRRVIIEALLANSSTPLSAEEVFIMVRKLSTGIGLATVYRTLELLCELRLAGKISFDDQMTRYEMRTAGQEHMPHHLICRDCGAVKELKEDWLEELEQRVLEEFGFLVTDHQLSFKGYYRASSLCECSK